MKIRHVPIFSTASFLLDGLLVACSFHLANWVRFHSGWLEVGSVTRYSHYAFFLLGVVVFHWVVFNYVGLYRKRRGLSGVDEFSKVARGVLLAAILIAACTFLIKFLSFSRLVIGLSAVFSILGVWTARIILRRVQVLMRRKGIGVTRVMVVGTGEAAQVLLRRLRQNPGLGYRVVGVVSEEKSSGKVEDFKIVGALSNFNSLMLSKDPEEVIFALPATAHGKLIPMLVSLQDTGVQYKIVSDLFGLITHPLENDVLLDMPIFQMKEAPLGAGVNRAVKRVFDFVLTLVGTILVLPFLLALTLGVKLSSPGPVFFRQKRVGKDHRIFWMLKFRSMREGSETMAFTAQNDPRVTAFGSFLRRTSLDELPQLFNVLRGEMSLVGPRPEVPGLVEKFGKEIPRYFERHQVKSGITGWAQVNGFRGNTSLHERVKYDIYYIENWSLLFDIKILLRTLLELLEHEHAY